MSKWTQIEDEILTEGYPKFGIVYCLAALNRSRKAIYSRACLLGIKHKRRHCQVDEGYFDDIDTPNKAYVLGFLAADGFVFSQPGTGYCVQWGQQARDAQILEDIARDMKYDGGVKIRTIKKKRKDGASISVAYLYVYSQRLVERLKQLEARELNTEFIPDELLRHWLRGFFDGDGSVHESPTGTRLQLSFCVEPCYQKKFERVLARLGLPISNFYLDKRGKIGSYSYRAAASRLILGAMYDPDSLFLRRKWKDQ